MISLTVSTCVVTSENILQSRLFFLPLLLSVSAQVFAHDNDIETITIKSRNTSLAGIAISASEGFIDQTEISQRPLSRTGDVLEFVPGMVVTQHSGSGKANQYFLRGFNLDHGTDFATFVDGMPVNMRSHGHGQGYTDLNFIIPETIGKMRYKKGAYHAEIGDFSGAGSASFETVNKLANNTASVTLGENNYQRALLMADIKSHQGNTVLALEGNRHDGPWRDIDEDIQKTNLLLKHSQTVKGGLFNISFMTYDNDWNSADQIPARAVEQGIISELGSIDDTVGGESSRYSVSTSWQNQNWQASAYVIDYQLNLWSNFTYFLDDEVNGDQFEQVDDRRIYGGELAYNFDTKWFGYSSENRFGLQYRADDIDEVGLYHTQNRQRLGVTRSDKIKQSSTSLFWQNQMVWNHHFRTAVGLRYDTIDFEVDDKAGVNRFGIDLSQNSGSADDSLLSLKASAIYTINDHLESYVSFGQGFHSNDARGTTIRVDPSDGKQIDGVDPLVRSTGYEIGLRGFINNKLNTSVAFWTLDLDSELLFVGDAGNTEASNPSTRKGIEFVAYYYLTEQLSFDFEYAYTDAEFEDVTDGNKIPGAIKHVVQTGFNYQLNNNWFANLRMRYFGERPLIEDNSVTSDSTTTFNLRTGYQVNDWRVTFDLLNVLDSNDHDITYFYESRLSGEPAGVATEDKHYHVIEPRTVRLTAEFKF